MPDEIETIDKNPKSWAAWKREAERLQAIIDDMVLAAMDSKPVAEITEDLGRLFVKIHHPTTLKAGDKLYRHAQPAPAVPGKWIPVSERMPENDGAYLCWDNRYVTTYAFIFGAWQANQFVAKNITHWMPLPNPPKE